MEFMGLVSRGFRGSHRLPGTPGVNGGTRHAEVGALSETLFMWMPSNRHSLLAGRPLLDAARQAGFTGDDVLTLDWETIGRAIRECVLDAIEMHAAEHPAPESDIESSHPPKRGIDLE